MSAQTFAAEGQINEGLLSDLCRRDPFGQQAHTEIEPDTLFDSLLVADLDGGADPDPFGRKQVSISAWVSLARSGKIRFWLLIS